MRAIWIYLDYIDKKFGDMDQRTFVLYREKRCQMPEFNPLYICIFYLLYHVKTNRRIKRTYHIVQVFFELQLVEHYQRHH